MPAVTRRKASHDVQGSTSHITRQVTAPAKNDDRVVLRYQRYQDIIHVNSVEGQESRQRQLSGFTHYQHTMSQLRLDCKPSLDHTDYDDAQDLHNSMADDKIEPHASLSSPTSPHIPPFPPSTYTHPIYTGTTRNPATLLSILHVAQRNLPSLNLSSAFNHLPNTHPTDPLPDLHPSAPENLAPHPFVDATPLPKRDNDVNINVAFLPFLHGHDRHGIGYFEILRSSSQAGRKVGACLFTPCSEDELRRYGLVEYLEGREGDGVEGMRRIGAGKGWWVDRDTVEEYEEWGLVWKVVGRVWAGRLSYARGKLEG